MMAMDQNQEHCIQFTKHEGGPKGLYGQTEERDVIEISRPGILRAIQQFEGQLDGVNQADKSIKAHPESSNAEQKKFINHLSSLLRLVDEDKIINPFSETSEDLITLDTGEIMDPEIAACLGMVEEVGETMMREYVGSRVEKAEKPITDTISRPGLYTFADRPPVRLDDKKRSNPKSAQLFIKMFMSLRERPEADIREFFSHENQHYPPNISDGGKLNQSNKPSLLDCFPGMPLAGMNKDSGRATALVLDMPAVVHLVAPKRANKFSEYTPLQIIPYIEAQISPNTTHIDGLFDIYRERDLKNLLRTTRAGATQRRNRISGNLPIPKGKEWSKMLQDTQTKSDIFSYLSDEMIQH